MLVTVAVPVLVRVLLQAPTRAPPQPLARLRTRIRRTACRAPQVRSTDSRIVLRYYERKKT